MRLYWNLQNIIQPLSYTSISNSQGAVTADKHLHQPWWEIDLYTSQLLEIGVSISPLASLKNRHCRERKKAKLQSQSKDVEDLTQQMQDYEGLNAGVRAMETRKAALEQDLWAKEAEIERIK